MVALSDGEILNTFLRNRDEEAFAQLVERHGPMVLGVCERVLNSRSDAEDAAQAVFLTLAHKAGSLDRSKPLAGWLHRVAWQVSLDAKKRAKVRVRHEQQAARPDTTKEERDWQELVPVLDEELNALPEKYRHPILLHYIEGHTHAELSRLMKQPAGTVSTHLNRGRELLRERLMRRGVMLSGAVLATTLTENAGAQEVPAALVAQTSRAASLMAAGNTAAAGMVSSQVSNLTKGALNMLFMAKMKSAAMILACVGISFTAAGIAYKVAAAETKVAKEEPQPKPMPLPNQPKVPVGPLDRRVTVDFVDTPLSEGVEFMRSLLGNQFTIVLNKDVKNVPITLKVSDMPIKTALDWMAKLADATVKTEGNTLTIQTGVFFDAEKQAEEEDLPWEIAINKALESKLSVDFVETPLNEFTSFLNSVSKVNIIVNPKVLINPKAPTVTFKTVDMPMKDVLKHALGTIGMSYDLRNQAVYISNKADIEIPTSTKIYDIRDLLSEPALKLTMPGVISTLKSEVAPGKWKSKWGVSIEENGGKLTIKQRVEEHQLIADYFANKREELWAIRNPIPAAQKAAIKKKLEDRVSFEFVDKPFDDVVGFFRTKTGVTIIVDPKAIADGAPPINLRVTDMTADLALQWTLRLADLDYVIKDNAVYISKRIPKP